MLSPRLLVFLLGTSLLAVTSAVDAGMSPPAPHDTPAQTSLGDRERQNQEPSTAPSVATTDPLLRADERYAERGGGSDERNQKIMARTNISLAVFTGLLVVVGALQVWLLRQNAATTRALERPWIAFELQKATGLEHLARLRMELDAEGPDVIKLIDQSGRRTLPEVTVPVTVHYAFTNGGRTVARITGGAVRFDCVDLATLPPNPDYGSADENRMPDVLLLPNRPERMALQRTLDDRTVLALLRREAALVFYGYISYEAVSETAHETRFCMVCQFSEDWPGSGMAFRLGGPDSYHRAT